MTINRPMPVTAHAPHCAEPEWEWQPQIWPGLARLGRCRNCGATRIDRSGQTQKPATDNSRQANR
jgi:hypothetical protein